MSEPESKAGRRGRGGLWLVCGVVVVLVVAGGAWYAVQGNSDDPCAPMEATGETEPVKTADKGVGDDWFRVEDSGFMPFQKEGGLNPDEGVSFGYLVKNPSEYVLHDARLRVRFVTPDGREPANEVSEGDQKESAPYVEDVRLPVLFPGQKAGLGGHAYTWNSTVTDADGDIREPESVDYGALKMEVELVSGQWWKAENDKYAFTEVSAADTAVDKTEPTGFVNLDGKPGDQTDVRYRVKASPCQEHRAYEPSLLAYDKKGDIVGGTVSGGLSEQTIGANGVDDMPASVVTPSKDTRVKVYPYAEPTKPQLKQ